MGQGVEFLIKKNLERISLSEIVQVRKAYIELLKEHPFPKPEHDGVIEMINFYKRSQFTIGPWQNITPFEAANRIASDLVILSGVMQLAEQKNLQQAKFTLRLGTTHVRNKGDITVFKGRDVWEIEAFNVASSFLATKLYKTRKKWEGKDLKYILINSDAFAGSKVTDEKIFIVSDWHKLV